MDRLVELLRLLGLLGRAARQDAKDRARWRRLQARGRTAGEIAADAEARAKRARGLSQ